MVDPKQSWQSGPMGAPAGGPVPIDDTIDLRAYLAVLRKRWWTILAVFVLVVAAVALWTMRQPRIYTASTSLVIDPVAPKVLQGVDDVVDLGAGNYWAAKEYYETQYRVIQSREVSERVVDRLGLASDLDFLGVDEIEDPEERAEALERIDPIETLQDMISVNPVKDSRMVHVAVSDTDPERAALLSAAVAEAYLVLNVEKRTEGTRNIAVWLDEQVRELKPRLEASEQALFDFKRENDMLSASLEDRQNMVSQKLLDLTARLTELRTRRLELEAKVRGIEGLQAGQGADLARLDAISDVTGNSLIQKLKEDLFKRLQTYAELQERYLDKHPKLIAAQEAIESARETLDTEVSRIVASIRNDHATLLEAERSIEALLSETKDEAFEINQKEISYRRLAREKEENQRLYDLVLQRLKEAGLAAEQRTNNVRIVDAAVVPEFPVKPRVMLNLLLALVLGAFLGIGVAFVLEFLDTSVKSQEDVENELGLSLVGSIPRSGEGTPGRPHVLDAPHGALAEACRSLRTNLLFMDTDAPLRRLVVTSAGPGEGKTTLTADLGVVMAQSGARVILVDTDMRRPRLHGAFGIDGFRGLSSVLLGECSLEEALQTTDVPGLSVLPCGPLPPNPAELLHTSRFEDILRELAGRADRVILDSPPLGAVADAKVLAAQADGVLLVAKAGTTPKDALRIAAEGLFDVRARILGVVLNFVAPAEGYAAGYYGAPYGDDTSKKAA